MTPEKARKISQLTASYATSDRALGASATARALGCPPCVLHDQREDRGRRARRDQSIVLEESAGTIVVQRASVLTSAVCLNR